MEAERIKRERERRDKEIWSKWEWVGSRKKKEGERRESEIGVVRKKEEEQRIGGLFDARLDKYIS